MQGFSVKSAAVFETAARCFIKLACFPWVSWAGGGDDDGGDDGVCWIFPPDVPLPEGLPAWAAQPLRFRAWAVEVCGFSDSSTVSAAEA